MNKLINECVVSFFFLSLSLLLPAHCLLNKVKRRRRRKIFFLLSLASIVEKYFLLHSNVNYESRAHTDTHTDKFASHSMTHYHYLRQLRISDILYGFN